MDFLDPQKKREHRIRLFVGYGLTAIALGFATYLLVFAAYGFGVDRKTGSVIQNGIIFVDAHPANANIRLNGQDKGQTDARLVVPEGRYTVGLSRNGYRPWARSFTLKGSTIERLVYPFLFPEKLDSSDIQLYAQSPQFSTQSPDRKWVMVQRTDNFINFDLFDLSQDNVNAKSLSYDKTLFTSPDTGTHKLELAEWSNDNRHVMVKHSYDGGYEYVMLDREDAKQSFNINKAFNASPAGITLRDKKYDQLYMYTQASGALQIADVKTKQITPLLAGVIAYKTYSTEEVLYVTAEGAPAGKVFVKIRAADKQYILRELPASDPNYLVDISKFDGSWFMVAGASSEKKAYIYKDPFDVLNHTSGNKSPIPEAVLKTDKAAQFVSFSANVRFIAMQAGSEFAVYDNEMEKLFRYDTNIIIADGQKAMWMDGHRLHVVSGGNMVVFDYDGINKQSIIDLSGTSLPYFDRDYNRLFTLSASKSVTGKPALVQSYMRIASDR